MIYEKITKIVAEILSKFLKMVTLTHACHANVLASRVARWYIFKPKIQIWVNFERPAMEDCIFYGHLVKFSPFDTVYDHLVYVHPFWYIFAVVVCCTKKNLATLLASLTIFHRFVAM
jgi:hypothetical protein